ncbi:DNA polymerase III subunit delta' [Boudabousia marimammalium]|uniref:DNA polymerase III subunit delta n=1 Tax=Boudabousia marimammalium TaxID=156892 RepID=A0A1Q5PMI9_9ACTO|nr:DNA polymerase III subunit delta' [Boudabousia marimammalium]OKL48660.1 DNA polymerase III subunit delta' [Boudabousia marimammalium]
MTVWDKLIGQSAAAEVLTAAAEAARHIVERRIAEGASSAPATAADATPLEQERSMTHAWLITGPPGSGRSTAARAFAAALQCTGPQVGCGVCEGCRAVLADTHPDVTTSRTQKVVISIEEVRQLVSGAYAAPQEGRWRVIIVEDADRMVQRTTNTLLKAIEEPPERTVWLLCTPSPEDVLTTIRSRCRNVALRIPPADAVASYLVEESATRPEGPISPEIALQAARIAQSHIGRARPLAMDEEMRAIRRERITKIVRVRSAPEAVYEAKQLVDRTSQVAKDYLDREAPQAIADLKRTLGYDEKERIPPAIRSQIKDEEEKQQRIATRRQRDELDFALVDLLSFYRDVVVRQLGSEISVINTDLAPLVDELAAQSSTEQTLARMDAIAQARKRIAGNVPPQLAVEAMMITLRPQS